MNLIWYLLCYSLLGFVGEVLYARLTHSAKPDRKCRLFLPLCPVYGIGATVIALLPLSPSRTLLHIRERHEASGRELALVWAGVSAESLSSLSMLRDLREACMAHAEHA